MQVARLRIDMELLYEHGAPGDVNTLCAAFDLLNRGWREQASCERSQATLVEALAVLGLSPLRLVAENVQQRPQR